MISSNSRRKISFFHQDSNCCQFWMKRLTERDETDAQTKKTRSPMMFVRSMSETTCGSRLNWTMNLQKFLIRNCFESSRFGNSVLIKPGLRKHSREHTQRLERFFNRLRSIYFKYGIRVNCVVNLIDFDDRDLRVWDEKLNGSIFSINSLINRVL